MTTTPKLTDRRRSVIQEHLKDGSTLTEAECYRVLGLSRMKFCTLRLLYAREELNRLWNSKN